MTTSNETSKVVLVTGGSRGIGRSIAINAAKRGLGVILTYNSQPESGQAVADEINNAGGKAIALHLDAGKPASFDEFAKQISAVLHEEWGRDNFDYLVNNAGIAQRSLIQDTTEEIFDQLVNVNLKGVFFLSQKLIPLIVDGGQIINISSGLARFAFPGTAVYGALKAGLEGLTRYFAKEYAARKIRVNSVAPGAIDTEFGGGKGDEEHRQQIAAAAAIGRLGVADDIGLFVTSMLSDDSRFVNAQRIEVGGGIMI
ncbi:NAD(P)-dependent dehydrogenase (short-subunit alcohol dehydrogenase family) [Mucilaginibacter gracilis]|uniref:NAD(P)-dependent dehydrogenase (Short-subunit alcohol dehydrogenase family) n=1 Tax=Mucilaginibacter gracilis TaxID=423350 RepID=A0A495J6C5_9SPHI|nr:SDR family oxidoreductase [Mucilaginibacter gracilis]RKR84427.1 NAD(P)-dependent dehydrogenase (short-subunit alcohol dehydrogenase family) [Mucilaginibacter gracilis]